MFKNGVNKAGTDTKHGMKRLLNIHKLIIRGNRICENVEVLGMSAATETMKNAL